MVIAWRLRGNIIRTAPCWVVWHGVHSQQHTHMSSSYRSSRLGLSHWDSFAMHRGGCLELYYCNMVEWSWWDSSLICKTNWLISLVLWHCRFGHMTCKNRPRYDLYVFRGTLNLAQSINSESKRESHWRKSASALQMLLFYCWLRSHIVAAQLPIDSWLLLLKLAERSDLISCVFVTHNYFVSCLLI